MFNTKVRNEVKEDSMDNIYNKLNDTPPLRIGFLNNNDNIDFRLYGKFSVLNNEGITILKNVTTSTKLKIKIERRYRAQYRYNILLGKFDDFEKAQDSCYELIEKGLGAKIKTIGSQFYYKSKLLNDNCQYWVIIDNFYSKEDANTFTKENLAHYNSEIITERIQEPGALIELFDAELEKLCEAENVIRIIPVSIDTQSEIYDFHLNNSNSYYSQHNLNFQGILEFRCDDNGNLIIVGELPIERYIEGIINNELKSDYPYETLKALAIIIRSKTFAALNINHLHEPYDLCAGKHCHPFNGLCSNTSHNIVNAVFDTLGKVIIYSNKIFNAAYSLNCGGCTDHFSILKSEILTNLDTSTYDTKSFTAKENFPDLTNEKNAIEWINSYPEVFCNPHLNTDVKLHDHSFRWEVALSRQELEEIIYEKTGDLIGTIFDIIPVKRSISGRITELEILASNKNLILKGEKTIRNALSHDSLNSSCFHIEKEMDYEGIPISFIIKGAGSGHGVGLCQAGAISMAYNNYNYEQILDHYFNNIVLEKVY